MYWEEQNNSWISRFFLLYLLYSKTIKKPKYIRPTATIAVLYIFDCSNEYVVFKGTVSRDFWPFFCLKDSTWAPYELAKKGFTKYSQKTCVRVVNDYADMCQRSQQLRGHLSERLRWHTWNSFTSEKVKNKQKSNKKCNLIFSKIACPRSKRLPGLRRHINEYTDTFWKLWRLLTDVKGTIRQK